MTGTDLVYASASLEDRKNYARAIAAAGSLLPAGLMDQGQPSPGKILLVAETGNMLGIHPVAAITGVNIIQGKPSVAPALMSALVRQRGHKLRVKVNGSVATGDLAVTVTLIRSDDPDAPFDVTWTLQDAIDAGLVDSYALNPQTKQWAIKPASGKGTWKAYPRQMLLHRATAEVCRQGANEVVMGVYTPEELGANVNGEGEMVDITSTAIDRTQQPIDAEVVEQDHDGPAVQATMRETPNRNRGAGHNGKTDAPQRDAGDAAPSSKGTPPGAQRPGGSRGAGATPTGTAEPTRDHADVWADWNAQISEVDDLDQLIKLHAAAADRGVLDHRLRGGTSIEDAFLDRRQQILDMQAQVVVEPEDDDLDGLPF